MFTEYFINRDTILSFRVKNIKTAEFMSMQFILQRDSAGYFLHSIDPKYNNSYFFGVLRTFNNIRREEVCEKVLNNPDPYGDWPYCQSIMDINKLLSFIIDHSDGLIQVEDSFFPSNIWED